MAHLVRRIARHNTAKARTYAGPAGELTMDTEAQELLLQNGQLGGIRIASKTYVDQVTARINAQLADLPIPTNPRDPSVSINVTAAGRLTDAIASAYNDYYSKYLEDGTRVRIILPAGYTFREQLVFDGIDCSFMTITANGTITVDYDAIGASAAHPAVMDTENRYPMVYAINGAKSPIFSVLFQVPSTITNEQLVAKRIAGFTAAFGATIYLAPGAGIIHAERGASALYGGRVILVGLGKLTISGADTTTMGANFSNTYGRAVFASFQGMVHLPRTQASSSGKVDDPACYVIWNSFADLYQSNFSHSLDDGIYVRDGSVCCARETNVTYAAQNGFHALHGALLDARWHDNDVTGSTGAQYCSNRSILANGSAIVEAPELPCSSGGPETVSAVDGSIVNVCNAVITGYSTNPRRGIRAQKGSMIAACDTVISGFKYNAIQAESGSSVAADNASITNCGIYAHASRVSARNVTITGTMPDTASASDSADLIASSSAAIRADGAAVIDATGGKFVNIAHTAHLVYATNGAHVLVSNCNYTGSARDRVLYAASGTITATNASFTSSAAVTGNVIRSAKGGHVNVGGSTMLAPVVSVKIADGGNWVVTTGMNSGGATVQYRNESSAISANTLTPDGVIFA